MTVIFRNRFAGTVGTGLLMVGLSGCNPFAASPSTLSGMVNFAETPVEQGSIRLTPAGNTEGTGGAASIVGGKYQITTPGLVAGTYQVIIRAEEETGRMLPGFDGGPPRKETLQYIPPAYNRNTKLEVELKPGENRQDFDLVQ